MIYRALLSCRIINLSFFYFVSLQPGMKLKSTDYLLTMGQTKEIHLDTFIAEQDVVK